MKILSTIFVLFGIVSCVYMEKCPSYEDIYPCTCQEDGTGGIIVRCSERLLTLERLKYALNGLAGKENVYLTLSNFELGNVPSNFFYGILIKKLEIYHCVLDSLSDEGRPGLLGLEYSLEGLSIISSFTENITPAKLQLSHLVKLKELELTSNIIRELSDDWFSRGPTSLEYLTLTNNRIEKIGGRAFINLYSLKRLTLTGNRFGPIRRSMLPYSALQLEVIDLEDNALTELPDGIFSAMPKLSIISVRSNAISRLEQRVWYLIWGQLKDVKLEGNPIQCDGHMQWAFEIRRISTISGRCHSPGEFRGQYIQDLLDTRGRYGKLRKMLTKNILYY